MFRNLRNQVLASIVVVAMVFSLVPAIQVQEAKASDVLNVHVSVNPSDLAAISCDEIDGATYELYQADSRFANYELSASYNNNLIMKSHYSGSYYYVRATKDDEEIARSRVFSPEIDLFGESTYIFEDTDPADKIQNVIDTAFKTSESGQFGKDRFAFMFKPSSTKYDVKAEVGFYTQFAGLGLTPNDVNLNQIECKAEWMKGRKWDGSTNYNALCNFWRSIENVSSDSSFTKWAVSQATSMRKVYLKKGQLVLHDRGGYASGGFLADSKIGTKVDSGSQQQWISRNIKSNSTNNPGLVRANYTSAVWNNVMVGSDTSITKSDWPNKTNTVIDKTPRIAEKPYLAYEESDYKIVVPKVKENTKGVSWDDYTEGTDYSLIPSRDYYVAKPSDTAAEINAAIADKSALVLSPGIYNLDGPIVVNKDNFVVLGLGYATIKPTNGNECLCVSDDVTGVRLAGMLFDAGRTKSEDLLRFGQTKNDNDNSTNPSVISDCFFRVGGADDANCQVENCVEINTNDVICDNFWVWRADHGAGVGWNKNTADNGVTFNGDNITAYGLMVEHFQKQQTVWNGNGGSTYMYQSELPYDITSQSVWNEEGSYGYTDYKVSKGVTSHEGYGIGIYSCYQAAQCFLKSAVTCPDTPNVKFTNVCTYSLVGNGGIDKVINNAGYGVYGSSEMAKVLSYQNGVAKTDKDGDAGRKPIWACSYNSDIPNKAYTGKAIIPIKSLEYKGVKLREGVDYKITYKNNVKIGKATIILNGINNFKEMDEFYFKIVPGKVQLTKAKGTKKKIKVKYKKVLGAGGYEVQWAKKKSFKGKKVKKTKKLKYTIKRKDKKRKKYYVRVRAYKKVKGKYYYGKYSKKKKVK